MFSILKCVWCLVSALYCSVWLFCCKTQNHKTDSGAVCGTMMIWGGGGLTNSQTRVTARWGRACNVSRSQVAVPQCLYMHPSYIWNGGTCTFIKGCMQVRSSLLLVFHLWMGNLLCYPMGGMHAFPLHLLAYGLQLSPTFVHSCIHTHSHAAWLSPLGMLSPLRETQQIAFAIKTESLLNIQESSCTIEGVFRITHTQMHTLCIAVSR